MLTDLLSRRGAFACRLTGDLDLRCGPVEGGCKASGVRGINLTATTAGGGVLCGVSMGSWSVAG